MKRTAALLLCTVLAACSPSEAPEPQTDVPTVEELAANPERLKALRQQCRTDRAEVGEVLCRRVAEATNRRFLGDGQVPYTPQETPPKF